METVTTPDANQAKINEIISNLTKEHEARMGNATAPEFLSDSNGTIFTRSRGFRVNGPRKNKLIDKTNLHLMELGAKGVNVLMLLKLLGIEGDANSITTKQWSGVIGGIVKFRKENNV